MQWNTCVALSHHMWFPYLKWCPGIVNKDGQHRTWNDKEVVSKRVLLSVVCDFDDLVIPHQVEDPE
eukprot:362009-Chlamydomonas_euryale.AAC.6